MIVQRQTDQTVLLSDNEASIKMYNIIYSHYIVPYAGMW